MKVEVLEQEIILNAGDIVMTTINKPYLVVKNSSGSLLLLDMENDFMVVCECAPTDNTVGKCGISRVIPSSKFKLVQIEK